MNYYELLVGDPYFHGTTTLTYASGQTLGFRSIVEVPLRNRKRLGIVVKKVDKPSFAVRSIGLIYDLVLPEPSYLLLSWLREYYPGPLGATVQIFLPGLLPKTNDGDGPVSDNETTKQIAKLPPLTKDQQTVLERVANSSESSFLLHGDTGSGKTRIYIELAKKVISQGKNVLILTPEIGLTSQLENQFHQVFGDITLVMHSNLTPAKRRTGWLKVAQAKNPLIVIGPRSTLFAPLNNIGLIVVDEAHETAYKQEQTPYYYAPRVAAKLSQIHRSQLVFGTATPLVSEYYFAVQKNLPILRMKEQAVKHHTKPPVIKTVQIRDRSQFSHDTNLSDPLIGAIGKALDNKEQSLVFLNRRGSARVILCQSCGWQALCPRCDLPLTYHSDSHLLRCHTCGYSQAPPPSCPVCSSADIIYRGIGTKTLESRLKQFFPNATIKRFDADNLKADRLEHHLSDIQAGKTDIIVGTQLLAKGLDIPKLAVVGVVAADSSLYLPDFTAEERTYQLLNQVIGRVGRGHRAGTAIVQTYNPESMPLVAALGNNWQKFYDQQLAERQQFVFPPFCYLLRLSCGRKSQRSAEQAASELKKRLAGLKRRIIIIGPAPAFHERVGKAYRWQLVIKAKNRQELLNIIPLLPANWTHDLDPLNLL